MLGTLMTLVVVAAVSAILGVLIMLIAGSLGYPIGFLTAWGIGFFAQRYSGPVKVTIK